MKSLELLQSTEKDMSDFNDGYESGLTSGCSTPSLFENSSKEYIKGLEAGAREYERRQNRQEASEETQRLEDERSGELLGALQEVMSNNQAANDSLLDEVNELKSEVTELRQKEDARQAVIDAEEAERRRKEQEEIRDEQERLDQKANNYDFRVRLKVAENPLASKETLDRLANDLEEIIRFEVAKNPSTSKETLDHLAHDSYRGVRFFVVRHPSTSEKTLNQLANDNDKDVLEAVAFRNPSVSKKIEERILECERITAINSSTPKETLDQLSTHGNKQVRLHVAINPSTPKETLNRLANDNEEEVRQWVARNPSTPKETLDRLAHDSNERTCKIAKFCLNGGNAWPFRKKTG